MSLSVCPRQSTLTRPKLPESSWSSNYAAHNNNALPSHTASSLLLLLIFLRSIHLACSLYLSPSQVFIYSLHAYCRLSMGMVMALIKGQPILTESPPTMFLFLPKSSNEKNCRTGLFTAVMDGSVWQSTEKRLYVDSSQCGGRM